MTSTQPTAAAITAPAAPTPGARLRHRPVPLGAARITGGFWAARQDVNRRNAIRTGYERLEEAGNLQNLRIAAGTVDGEVRGPIFMDSDVYKWLEAAAWEYGREADEQILGWIREVTDVVAAAQADDGYLDSVVQVREKGVRYRDLPWSHEHYCAGHLFQAAVAVVRATGEHGLLDVAVRLADHLVATFGPAAPQAGRIEDVDGHPVVEMALVELYRETGTRAYLDLALWFTDARGTGMIAAHGKDPAYFSDRLRVREQDGIEGHAVRAVYLTAGAADVAAETGDDALLDQLVTQWETMTGTKAYVTGGLGSRWDMERFGDAYELGPERAYAETCAAIGSIQWTWRMLLATGEARYADLIERTLYNAFLPGVSLDGDHYFYVNALQLREGALADEERNVANGRLPWFDCACCPPNIMRTLSSLDAYVATTSGDGVQIHQHAPATVATDVDGVGRVALTVETDYPWDGVVRVEITEPGDGEWELALRVPAWATGATASVGGEAVPAPTGDYLRVRRTWAAGDVVELTLPMGVRVVQAHPRVDAARDAVALERGPLVYCLEHADQPGGIVPDDVRVRVPELRSAVVAHEQDLLGGVTTLTFAAHPAAEPAGGPLYREAGDEAPPAVVPSAESVRAVAIPYYAWANREIGPMRVWLPRA